MERKKDEMVEEWLKLHNEEVHNLYSSPNIIIMMIKQRRMRWTGICDEKRVQGFDWKA
jgi:hypothetical protein